eukprot:IDg13514t1
MNYKLTLSLIVLIAATAHAAVSTESRAQRERRIRSALGRNAFVNRADSPVNEEVSIQASPLPVVGTDVPPTINTAPETGAQKSRIRQTTVGTMLDLQDKIIQQGGCNRNLCFTLDASSKLSKMDFLLQRDFVQIVVATLGVDRTWNRQTGRRHNFLSLAMWGCRKEMKPRRTVDANKMVVIGNGRTSRLKKFFARRVARIFRRRDGGSICAVAVDNSNRRFFAKLTRSTDRVLSVTDYFKFDLILKDIVRDICGLR